MGLVFSVHKAILVSPLRIRLKEFTFYKDKCCTFEAKHRPGTIRIQGTTIRFLSPNLTLVILCVKLQKIHTKILRYKLAFCGYQHFQYIMQ